MASGFECERTRDSCGSSAPTHDPAGCSCLPAVAGKLLQPVEKIHGSTMLGVVKDSIQILELVGLVLHGFLPFGEKRLSDSVQNEIRASLDGLRPVAP